MIKFLSSRIKSFRPAFSGWWYVLRTQQNAWIHASASIAVFLLGWLLKINRSEWVAIIIAVALVWMAEFLNTALEAIVDLASPENHPLAKVGKDIGAAAVLIAALAAVAIGLFILGPPLWQLILSKK